MNKEYTLTVFGCRGSYFVSGEHFDEYGGLSSCYILNKDDYALVIDCGTGLYNAEKLLASCKKIDVIFTHMHYDHILGLLYGAVFPKDADVNFYGTFKKWRGDSTIRDIAEAPYWPYVPNFGKFNEIENNGYEFKLNDIVITAYPANHPNESTLYSLQVNNKKIAILFDMEHDDKYDLSFAKDADLAFYDGMYDDETYEQTKGYGHSTWQEGCRLATKLNIKKMIITHHSPFNNDIVLRELENKAKKLNGNSLFCRAGDVYII